MVLSSEIRIKKRSERILKMYNSVKGKELPKFHKKPMFIEKFGATMISAQRGKVEIECGVNPDMVNPVGFLHGGVQCVLIDDVMGLAAATLGSEGFTISINLQISFLSKVRIGDKIRVKAKIIREGRKLVNATAKIIDIDGNLIAVGQSDLLNTQINRNPVEFLKNE